MASEHTPEEMESLLSGLTIEVLQEEIASLQTALATATAAGEDYRLEREAYRKSYEEATARAEAADLRRIAVWWAEEQDKTVVAEADWDEAVGLLRYPPLSVDPDSAWAHDVRAFLARLPSSTDPEVRSS